MEVVSLSEAETPLLFLLQPVRIGLAHSRRHGYLEPLSEITVLGSAVGIENAPIMVTYRLKGRAFLPQEEPRSYRLTDA